MTAAYVPIAGGYSYAPLRVGLVVRNPAGQEVYCQPGDDTDSMLATIESLEEVADDRRGIIADTALGDYFNG